VAAMSATPRTDAVVVRCACSDYVIEPDFARTLERENTAMKSALIAVRKDLTETNSNRDDGPGSIYDALECEGREYWAKHAIKLIDEALQQ
jgi:hypothetical protein